MKNTRFMRKVRKLVLLVACIALVAGLAIGGTIAWLVDDTDPVVNTFTPAGIEIELTETPNDGENWTAHLIPGKEYPKNPHVAVLDGVGQTDVDVYLFVKFEATTSATYLEYTSNLDGDDWDLVTGETDVYWRRVNVGDSVKGWDLLDGNKVTVKNLTEAQMPSSTESVTMTYTAYAIQVEGFKTDSNTDAAAAALAWAEIGE